jgi:hypothetical protein
MKDVAWTGFLRRILFFEKGIIRYNKIRNSPREKNPQRDEIQPERISEIFRDRRRGIRFGNGGRCRHGRG